MGSLRERARRKTDKPGAEPEPSRPEDRIDVAARFPAILATVSICGAASNAGKTWLCESVLRGLEKAGRRALALKVTRTHLGDCPRGIDTCGTCDSLSGDFEVVRDRSLLDIPRKDTGRYFAAGADHVLWLLVKPSSMRAGILAALAEVPAGCVLVAEGNSFRDYASADVALMALSRDGELKASARHVLDRIDACVRHHRTPDHPHEAGTGISQRPLLRPEEAWPFVQNRIAAALLAGRGPQPAPNAGWGGRCPRPEISV